MRTQENEKRNVKVLSYEFSVESLLLTDMTSKTSSSKTKDLLKFQVTRHALLFSKASGYTQECVVYK